MAGFTVQVFENSSLEVSEKKRNRSNTSTGARPDRKVRFILGELFDTWSWQPNDRMWFWLDGFESCCVGWKAPVKASVSGISLLQLSPIFPSIPFSPETPDTQAKKVLVITTRDCYILSGSFTTHMSQISAMPWNGACSLSLWTKSYHIHIERKYPFDISFKMHYLFSRDNFMNLSLIFSPDCFEGRRKMYT